MKRSLLLSIAALALIAGLAFAAGESPTVAVEYFQGVPRVRLEGSYAGQTYRVFRSDGSGAQTLLVLDDALCTGDCYVLDRGALAGGTYQYTFQFPRPDGTVLSYGPFDVTIGHAVEPGARLALSPNPTRRGARVRVDASRAAGDPAARVLGQPGAVTLLDVRGRLVRRLWSGGVQSLTFDVDFDGQDAGGRALAPGLYFAHFRSGNLTATTRLVVTR